MTTPVDRLAVSLADRLTPRLREMGRLAALAGDREAAVRAYRHYLAIRTDPDPALIPQRDSVRAELAALTGESQGQ